MADSERARELRREATDPERVLWRHLRNRQLAGAKFRRQHPIGRYVVDLVCVERRLVVEVDGVQHGGSYDQRRDAELGRLGFAVIRIPNGEVRRNLEAVLEQIARMLEERR
jgi:very-short-patch-repair endonuclease